MNNLFYYIRYMMGGLSVIANSFDNLEKYQEYMISLVGEEIPYSYFLLLSKAGNNLGDSGIYSYRRYRDINTVQIRDYKNRWMVDDDGGGRIFETYWVSNTGSIIKQP